MAVWEDLENTFCDGMYFIKHPCVLPWQSCSIVPMWRCVWSFWATYIDQPVSVALNLNTALLSLLYLLRLYKPGGLKNIYYPVILFMTNAIMCRSWSIWLCPAQEILTGDKTWQIHVPQNILMPLFPFYFHLQSFTSSLPCSLFPHNCNFEHVFKFFARL